MAKDPARRPSTAGDLLEALEDALDDADAPTAVAVPVAAREPARTPPPSLPRPPVATARRRWPGIAALVAIAGVAGAVIAIALGSSDGSGGDGSRQASTSSTPTRSTPAAQKKPKPKAQKRPKAAGPATPQATAADPVALNDQGFSLLNQGQAAQAVTPLERSVTAFRAQGRKGDIGYAYALYNLGNALRLSGRPADAIPYLQERLAISNFKRGIVRKELKAAQAQAA